MYFQRIFTPGLSIYSYLLGDEGTKRCAVIDPARNPVPYIMLAQNAGYDITDILETHVHADFVSGSKELKHQLNEKPRIYASGMGGKEWIPAYTDEVVHDGTELILGDLRLKALHTPGHTPEHLIWICYDDSRSSDIPWFAFTGDCLFVGSIGRPDLLGEKEMDILAPQLYHTLFDVLAPIPDFVEILPSHGEGSICGRALKTRGSSTFGYERLFNPYFKKEPQQVWIKKLEEGLLPAPPYCQRVKKVNVIGPPLLSTLKTFKWGEEGSPPLDQLFLLDIRLPESFALSHLKGSVNIPASPTFVQWAGWMVPENQTIGLIAENHHTAAEVVDQLRLMGFDQEIGIIQSGEAHAPYPTASFPMMDAEELGKLKLPLASHYLIDVRTPDEWRSGHIPGAHHIEFYALEHAQPKLPKGQPIVLICRSGHRASLAASLLEKYGFSVINVRGGMEAWKQAGLPLEEGA